ncbi:hypothetical protein G9A89_000447 [Geosiphon pyriformis]|nr:hypothetical protein G9A89_000447 [Geosiphon pyriformis]
MFSRIHWYLVILQQIQYSYRIGRWMDQRFVPTPMMVRNGSLCGKVYLTPLLAEAVARSSSTHLDSRLIPSGVDLVMLGG